MFKWIVENEIAIGNFSGRDDIKLFHAKKIRAIISISNGNIPTEWILQDMVYKSFPVENPDELDMFTLREFLLYSAFLKKVHFPFLISYGNDILYGTLFAALYLIYTGNSLKDSTSIVASKTKANWNSKQMKLLKDFKNNISLYYLNNELTSIYEFNNLIRLLRKQCPWDREQTHISLIPELIEESLELAEAIKKNDFNDTREELGDVLLQVVLHSVIAEGEEKFNVEDVTNEIFEKMYRRHPHVFGKTNIKKSADVLKQWEGIKKYERKDKPVDIAKVLAALISAFDVQEYARKEGFDFSSIEQIEGKIEEELKEVKEALGKNENVAEEIGDLLFSVINISRFLRIDPAHSLLLSLEKFRKRFEKVREKANGKLGEMNDNEKNTLWNEAKKEV